MSTSLDRYRPDIDGIRAIAIVVVVLLHLGVPGFKGGLVGVDVFFVVSGYLITGIITRGLERGDFTLAHFYVRRINRIVPALLVVLCVTWIAGWMFMLAHEFKVLGIDVIGGSTFTSNVILWRGSGFFDSPDRTLTHLWSLAVEEQFYLFWPVTMLVVWRMGGSVRLALAAIIAISFAVGIWQMSQGKLQEAFYQPVPRLWEILAGALLFEVQKGSDRISREIPRDALSIAGACLFVAAIAVARRDHQWLGLELALPVVGTVMLIAAGPDAILNRTLLRNRAVVALGLISYPLYLWHLPLIAFGRIIFGEAVPLVFTLSVIPLSLALATGTYRFIEKPIRFGNRSRTTSLLVLACLVVPAALGFVAWNGAVDPRLEQSVEHAEAEWGAEVEQPAEPVSALSAGGPPLFVLRGDTTNTILLYGDSHIAQYWPRVVELSRQSKGRGPQVILASYQECPALPATNAPGLKWKGNGWSCDEFNRDVFAFASRPDVRSVVVAGAWPDSAFNKGLVPFGQQLGSLTKAGKRVYLVAPVRLTRDRFTGNQRRVPLSQSFRALAQSSGATIIDPAETLCGASTCRSTLDDGEPIYRNDGHLRAGFVKRHARWLDSVLVK